MYSRKLRIALQDEIQSFFKVIDSAHFTPQKLEFSRKNIDGSGIKRRGRKTKDRCEEKEGRASFQRELKESLFNALFRLRSRCRRDQRTLKFKKSILLFSLQIISDYASINSIEQITLQTKVLLSRALDAFSSIGLLYIQNNFI